LHGVDDAFQFDSESVADGYSSLLHGYRCQSRSDDVTRCVDVVSRRSVVLINFDSPALIHLNTSGLKLKRLRVDHATRNEQYCIRMQHSPIRQGDLKLTFNPLDRLGSSPQNDVDADAFEVFCQEFRHLQVHRVNESIG